MHILSSLTLVAALVLGANAFECVNDYVDNDAIVACCNRLVGNFVGDKDCHTDSISEQLSDLRK